jgi:hypothetical protein
MSQEPLTPYRPRQTVGDYLAIVLSPALIITLIGSLVFFLLEVLYEGAYEVRLKWILFWYVFGAVLIARIAMRDDIGPRARLYGLLLGVAAWLGIARYVAYPLESVAAVAPFINAGLILLIWWCAQRLTWDCTYIDDEAEATGQGLLHASGLEKPPAGAVDRSPGPAPEERPAAKLGPLEAWWERYQRYREGKLRRRPPGVWVVYFSLAALPLYGLGQSLIPPDEVGRRRYTFWLMTVYVASGLGLLVTTCFLGLRRYLRQRKLHMPAAMTGAWLTMGGVMIAVLLAAGALLPRPDAEYPLVDVRSLFSPERSASRFATKGDSPAKGEGRPGEAGKKGEQGGTRGKGEKGQGEGQEKGDGGSGKDKGDGGQGDQKDGDKGSGGDKKADRRDASDPKSADKAKSQARDDRTAKESREKGSDRDSDRQSGSSSSSSAPPTSGVSALFQKLAAVLKWVLFAVIALVVLFVILRAVLQFLANFTGWAQDLLNSLRNFWDALFGRRRGRGRAAGGEAAASAPPAPPPRPFSSFPNPFATGEAGRWPPRKLLGYTFAAFEAWARERGLGRHPGETPLEFADRVGGEVPGLEAQARAFAAVYARALYAAGGPPAGTAEAVRAFWGRLEVVTEQPLSA